MRTEADCLSNGLKMPLGGKGLDRLSTGIFVLVLLYVSMIWHEMQGDILVAQPKGMLKLTECAFRFE